MISVDELKKINTRLRISEEMINYCASGQFSREYCLKWLKDNGYTEDFIKYIMAQRGDR